MAIEGEVELVDARGKGALVAQEIAFAKILAGNNKTLRDRGVKRLARWLKVRSHGRCGMCAKKTCLWLEVVMYFCWACCISAGLIDG